MKRILIIENDGRIDETSELAKWISMLNLAECEIDYIFRAQYANSKEVFQKMNWCNTIAFETTFYYSSDMKSLAEILAKISHPIQVIIDNPMADEKVKKLIDDELAYKLRIHTFNSLEDDDHGGYHYVHIDLSDKIARYKKKNDAEVGYRTGGRSRPTGRRVKVGLVLAFNPEFDDLVTGQIVDELDMSEQDNEPNRGIWVWGKTEPVKLLNEGQYNEYKIVESSIEDKVESICKTACIELSANNVYVVLGIMKDDEMNSMHKANTICETLKIQKRGNRSKIHEIISA